MNIVIVEWTDSCTHHGWRNKEELKEMSPSKTISIGLLQGETDKSINIIPYLGTDLSQVCDVMSIPKGCIKRIRRLRIK